MELIPYSSREGQVVLRHRDALVIRDHASQRLEIRSAPVAECPTCKRPLRSSSPERHFDVPAQHDSWVDPQYFRMLQAGHDDPNDPPNGHSRSGSVRRLTRPTLPSGSPNRSGQGGSDVTIENVPDAEFVSSASAPQEGARIRRDAFSPNYFRRFFVEERELGRGGKGVVLLVRHEIDGCPLGHFACKRVPVGDDHAWLEKVLVEVELLAALSHPNLVSYRHVWLEDVQIHRFGPSVACAFILQQYCNGGDLLRYIVGDQPEQTTNEQLKAQMRRRSKGQGERPSFASPTQRHLPLEQIYSLFKDVTSGLAYLHSANYIHRDLKPSNCLLHHENGKLTCLISDFGEVQPSTAVRNSTGTTGTISYCAPEVLKMDHRGQFGNFTVKSDVFSLGMILYFLCFGRLPYRHANVVQEELEDIDQLREEIASWKGFQDERRERPDLPSRLYQLLKKMLALNPLERPSAAEVLAILNHETTYGGFRGGPRATSPPPLDLHNHRIQNLDSPLPPGTPRSEPQNQLHHPHNLIPRNLAPPPPANQQQPPQSALDSSSNKALLQKYQAVNNNSSSVMNSPRRRTHPMVLTRSQERHSASPDRSTNASRPSPTSSSVDHTPPSSPSVLTTPLLMPPPTTGALDTFRQQGAVLAHRAYRFAHANSASISLIFKLSLFLIKMASLTRVCWPFMVGLGIGVPLIAAAGLDLAVSSSSSSSSSSSAAAAASALATNGIYVQTPSSVSLSTSPWSRWGWKISLVLFALHFAALWATSRWGHLCVAVRDDWVNW